MLKPNSILASVVLLIGCATGRGWTLGTHCLPHESKCLEERQAWLDSRKAARAAWTPSAHDRTLRQSLVNDLAQLEVVAKRFYTAIGKFTPDLHLMRPYMQNIRWELFGENPDLFIGLNVLNFAAQEVVITGRVLGEKSECHIRVRPPGLQKFTFECEWL